MSGAARRTGEAGCSSCGSRPGCDHRKEEMLAAVDRALASLYPTRRWGERDEQVAFQAGVGPGEASALAARLAERLRTMTLHRPGGADDWSDYVYVLCFGRPPTILEAREGAVPPGGSPEPGVGVGGLGPVVEERYLRIALSQVVRFAAVQEVALRLAPGPAEWIVTEETRAGVFDPLLLARLQAVVAALGEHGIRHVDFGDVTQPPAGFDDGDYPERYGVRPAVANYLFFPQPATLVSATILRRASP